uniref:SCP domain-containing protein n=2 Tax=Globodera pallida TaxID=36090 RepID=A0A183BZZ7_GLOPA
MDVSNTGLLVAFALLTALTFPGLSWGDDWASSPEELTECQKMAAKCQDNWGECFDRHAYNAGLQRIIRNPLSEIRYPTKTVGFKPNRTYRT